MSWHGIMHVIELQHIRDGQVIQSFHHLNNLLHQSGEEFILKACFLGGQVSNVIPANYYIGLDSRAEIAITDTMTSITSEPSGSGYDRQTISSAGAFVISLDGDVFKAVSPIVTFQAVSGPWGPVTNLFMTTALDDSGYLICSVVLPQAITVAAGDSVTMRMAMALKDCT